MSERGQEKFATVCVASV